MGSRQHEEVADQNTAADELERGHGGTVVCIRLDAVRDRCHVGKLPVAGLLAVDNQRSYGQWVTVGGGHFEVDGIRHQGSHWGQFLGQLLVLGTLCRGNQRSGGLEGTIHYSLNWLILCWEEEEKAVSCTTATGWRSRVRADASTFGQQITTSFRVNMQSSGVLPELLRNA